MATEAEGECTPLLTRDDKPKYVFDSSINRQRKRKIRQFQWCLCAIFLCALSAGLVVATAYTLGEILTPKINNTNTSASPENALFVLASLNPPDLKKTLNFFPNDSEWSDALTAGQEALESRDATEKTTPNLKKDSPSYKHQKLVATSAKSRRLSRFGYAEQYATKYLNAQLGNFSAFCGTYTINGTYPELCEKTRMTCNPYHLYRSYNGICNNLENPELFGVAYTPFRRMVAADYADGIGQPRVAKSGNELPSARTVSLTVHRPYYKDDPKFTIMLAVWGQFLDHDITATALSFGANGSTISCCSSSQPLHPECFPVMLDSYDPYYEDYDIKCMEFVRSAPMPTCCLGPREQMNQVSSYIDGSMIYGSELDAVLNLRSMKNGMLKTYVTADKRTLLPISNDPDDGCNREEQAQKGRYCFLTGDARANENIHLTSMHLLWVRQHNRVAQQLLELNPHWNDEKVFQEARKILTAQIQHITYNEFLPILLGPNLMESKELYSKKRGYFEGYNSSVDASIANGFAASAFRFAHTLIPSLMKLLASDDSNPELVLMHKMLLDPFQLYQPMEMDKAIRGALHTHIQASDPYFSSELKQHLFARVVEQQNNSRACGLDLVSLNIQRGRDHGLPGYTIWRENCGLQRPHTFEQLAGVIDDDSLNYINSIYSDPDDIDLYTGALSEKPLEGSILGPTLTCIIQDQFMRLKRGDRFWYENAFQPQAFDHHQLQQIRKTSLARIICDSSDSVVKMQPLVMQRNDEKNRIVSCKSFPEMDLKFWKESYVHVPLHEESVKIIVKP